jgi:hypothetical protein
VTNRRPKTIPRSRPRQPGNPDGPNRRRGLLFPARVLFFESQKKSKCASARRYTTALFHPCEDVHQTLKMTSAMAVDVSPYVWSVEDLVAQRGHA